MTNHTSNPKIGVAVVVVRDGKILLGKRKCSEGEGTWGNPGGKLEPGETPYQCAVRELKEETGMTTTVDSLKDGPWVMIRFTTGNSYLTLFLITKDVEGEPQNLEETKCEGWEWFDPNNLPSPLFDSINELLKKQEINQLLL